MNRSLSEHAARRHPVKLRFIENERYESTNTIHSLWLARDSIDGDFFYFNADVLFDPAILTRLVAQPGTALAVDEKACGAEEVKVICDESNRVTRIGKTLDPNQCRGEFIGIAKFDATITSDFVSTLTDSVVRRNRSDLFFEAALDELLDQHTVKSMSIAGSAAIEIDTPDDFDRARRAVSEMQRCPASQPAIRPETSDGMGADRS